MDQISENYVLLGFHYGYSGSSNFLIIWKNLSPNDLNQMLYEAAYNGTLAKYRAFIGLQRRPVIDFDENQHEIIVEYNRWDRLSQQDLDNATLIIPSEFAKLLYHVIFHLPLNTPIAKFYDLDGEFTRFRQQFNIDNEDPYTNLFVPQNEVKNKIYENALQLFHSDKPYFSVIDLRDGNVLDNMTVFTMFCNGGYLHIFVPKTLTRYELLCALQSENQMLRTYPPPLNHSIRAITNEDMKFPMLISYDASFPVYDGGNNDVLLYMNNKYFLEKIGRNFIKDAFVYNNEMGDGWFTILLAQGLLKTANIPLKDPEGNFECYQGSLEEIQQSLETIGALEARYDAAIQDRVNKQQEEEQRKIVEINERYKEEEKKHHKRKKEKEHRKSKKIEPPKKLQKIEKKKNVIDDDTDDDIMFDDTDEENIDDEYGPEKGVESSKSDYEIPSDDDEVIRNIRRHRASKRSEAHIDRRKKGYYSTKSSKMRPNKELDRYDTDDGFVVDDNDDLDFQDVYEEKRESDERQRELAREHFNSGTMNTYLVGSRYVFDIATPMRSYLITLVSVNPYYLIHILVPGGYTKRQFIDELLSLVKWYRETLTGDQKTPKPDTSIQISNVYLGLYPKFDKLPLLKVMLNAWEIFDMTLIDNFWFDETLDMILCFLGNIDTANPKNLKYQVDDAGAPITKNLRIATGVESMNAVYQLTVRGYKQDNTHFVRWTHFIRELFKRRTMNQDLFNNAGSEDVELMVGADEHDFKDLQASLYSKDPDI